MADLSRRDMRCGTDHELLCPHREGYAGNTMQVGWRMAVFAIGHGLCRCNGFAVEVSSARTVLHVVGPLLLIGPELPLRFVYHLLHTDSIACDAECIADGLCSKSEPLSRSPPLEGAEILLLNERSNGLTISIYRLHYLTLIVLHHYRCQQ